MWYENIWAVGILGGVIATVIVAVLKAQWPLIQSWFDKGIRDQASKFKGEWIAKEDFSGSKTKGTYSMILECKGRKVTGLYKGLTGPDAGDEFQIEGTFKDLVLTFMWEKRGHRALESGTITAKYVRENELEGHGLYIEPSDQKVYTSTFSAKVK